MLDKGLSVSIWGLKNCDGCRKAMKALQEAGYQADLRDIRQTPLSGAELSAALAAFGDALVNRRSTTWRGLDEAERARPPLELLTHHPSLMKRPVLQQGDNMWLGLPEAL